VTRWASGNSRPYRDHIELVEDRPCREQMFGRSEGLLTLPKLLAAQHGLKRVEIAIGPQHKHSIKLCVVLDLGLIDGKMVFADRPEVAA
jgi:hypothetical protein